MNWISVKDRLPEHHGQVIVYVPNSLWSDSHVFTTLYSTYPTFPPGWLATLPENWAAEITHWMPLPEPPKE